MLLALLVVLAVAWRKVGVVQLAVVCALASFVLSLGPRLTVDGHVYTIWLPESLFEHIPVLIDLEPIRFTGVGTMFLAIILAVGLDRTRTWLLDRARAKAASAPSGSKTGGQPRRQLPAWQTGALVAATAVAFVPMAKQLPIVREAVVTDTGHHRLARARRSRPAPSCSSFPTPVGTDRRADALASDGRDALRPGRRLRARTRHGRAGPLLRSSRPGARTAHVPAHRSRPAGVQPPRCAQSLATVIGS